jgi:hypothetical protein
MDTKELKIYIAGKVSPNSVFGKTHWRDEFCKKLSELSGYELVNLDPVKTPEGFDENNSKMIFGRNCFLIKNSDLVIVNLTDDISVGGSQEMIIAKYFSKPLAGLAAKEGKFNKSEREFNGKIYKDWKDSFVVSSCDWVFENIEELGGFLKNDFAQSNNSKNISYIDDAVNYYLENYYKDDNYLKNI